VGFIMLYPGWPERLSRAYSQQPRGHPAVTGPLAPVVLSVVSPRLGSSCGRLILSYRTRSTVICVKLARPHGRLRAYLGHAWASNTAGPRIFGDFITDSHNIGQGQQRQRKVGHAGIRSGTQLVTAGPHCKYTARHHPNITRPLSPLRHRPR